MATRSTFQSKFDDATQDIDQLRRQKEESEAVINNLRKTILDMAKQMKHMESNHDRSDLPTHLRTPSLSNISPRAKSEVNEDNKSNLLFLKSQLEHKDTKAKELLKQINDKESEISDLHSEFELQTKSLKDRFRTKFDEQNKFIEELRTELNQSNIQCEEYSKKVV